MTVSELIAALQEMPGDAEVAVWAVYETGDGHGGWESPRTVQMQEVTFGEYASGEKPRQALVIE